MCKFPLFLLAAGAMCLSAAEPVSAQRGRAPIDAKSAVRNSTPEVEFDKGNAAFDRKEWATAITHYTSALQQKPDFVPALINRSRACLFSGKLDDAVADSRKACELAPDQPAAHTWLAAALLDKGDHAAAIDSADKALKLDAKQAMAWYVRGTALIHKGEFAKAIDDLNEAAKLSPNDAVIYNNRGIAWQKLGDEPKAKADFNRRDQLSGSKQTALERMKQAEEQYKAIDAEVEVYEKINDAGKRLRPPQFTPIPPQLLQRKAAAWNALQDAIRVYKDTP